MAVRLAMLSTRYRVESDPDAASGASDRLRRWRELVASWANSPGRPMSADHIAAAAKAFDDDLDTPAVLSLLDRLVEDPEVPPGSKFETFAYLDLILGLDLVSAIGWQS
jgi:cysteinyl-tRNA synthetase